MTALIYQTVDCGADGTLNSTDRSGTWGTNLTTGDLMVVGIVTNNNNPGNMDVVDTGNHTWTRDESVYTSRGLGVWRAVAKSAANGTKPTVTLQKHGSGSQVGMVLIGINGQHSDQLDVPSMTANGTSKTPVGVSGAHPYTNDLILSIIATTNNSFSAVTPPAGYTPSVGNNNDPSGIQLRTAFKQSSASGVETAAWALSPNASAWIVGMMVVKGFTTAPTITSLGASSTPEGIEVVVNGVNFEAAKGAGSLVIGGTTITPTAWGDTQVRGLADVGQNAYGVPLNVQVNTNSTGSSNLFSMVGGITPPAGYSATTITTPNPTANFRLTTVNGGDIVSGCQVEAGVLTGMGVLTILASSVPVWDPNILTYRYRVWSPNTTPNWGAWATQTADGGGGGGGSQGYVIVVT